ncbi:MAG: sulfite exporter TauE/SafE family protein [Candidatus Nanopelagicales bacterium]
MMALTLALAVVVGITLGLLGGGGSILMTPLLIYVAGLEGKTAIAASLFVVGVTSIAGMWSHARAGRVRWRTGLIFGGIAFVGAFLGGKVGGLIPTPVVLAGFALMMLATAGAMIRGRKAITVHEHHDLPIGKVLVEGLVVGFVTGIVGAGGGFLVVPALALLGGLPMPVAVGTSLLVIAIKSFGGFLGYLSSVQIDWGLTLAVAAAAVVGGLIGGRLAGRVDPDRLRKGFGWFVLTMGVFMLVQQVPGDLWSGLAGAWWAWTTVLLVAGTATVVWFAVLRPRRTRPTPEVDDRPGDTGRHATVSRSSSGGHSVEGT